MKSKNHLIFFIYQKRLLPLGIEVVEDDRSLGDPGKRRNNKTIKHRIAKIPGFSKFHIHKGISDILLVVEFAVPVLHVGDILGLLDLDDQISMEESLATPLDRH